MSQRLLSDVMFVRLSLDEANGNGKITVKGEFAKCGVATENKRVYPEAVWNKEIGRLNKALGDRRVFGEMDHPSDGRTSLNRVSHIVTNLKITKSGLVEGEAEILPTESGKNLSALLASGCKVGVSSRGYGSTKSNDKGEEVVQPDYKLVTFDFVAEPADGDAFPNVQESADSPTKTIFEGVALDERGEPNMSTDKKLEQQKAAEFARKVEAERDGQTSNATVRDEFSKSILDNITKMKSEAKEEARQELLADPAVGAAKKFVEQLKDLVRPFWYEGDSKAALEAKDAELTGLKNQLAERDLKLKGLEDDNAKLISSLKEVGYKFWMETALSRDPDADIIRKAVGDVKAFENIDALKTKVEAIRKDFVAKREEAKAIEAARKAELDEAKKSEADARALAEEKTTQLEEALQKALQAQKHTALKLYAEQRLTNHPHAAKIRPLLEGEFSSTKEIDEVVATFRDKPRDADETEAVRARVRKVVGGGDEDLVTEEEQKKPSRRDNTDYHNLGIGIGQLQKLSGIQQQKK